jgi:hypothetical protein
VVDPFALPDRTDLLDENDLVFDVLFPDLRDVLGLILVVDLVGSGPREFTNR